MDIHLNGPEDALVSRCGILTSNVLDGKEMACSTVSQARLKPLQGIAALSLLYMTLCLSDSWHTNTCPLIIIFKLRWHEEFDIFDHESAGSIQVLKLGG